MPSIAPDQLSEFGATGIMILVASLFGLLAILKGIARLVCTLAAGAVASGAGYLAHQNSDLFLEKLGLDAQPWMAYIVASLAGIGSVFAVRSFFRTFFFKDSDEGKKHFGLKAGFIGLVVGCIAVFSGMTGIRYADGIEQLSEFKKKLNGEESDGSLVSKARDFFESSQVGKLLAKLDFINDSEKIKAAKLLLAQKLKGEKAAPGSMENPLIAEVVSADEVQKDIDAEDFTALLNSDAVQKLLSDPKMREKLKEIDLDSFIEGESAWADLLN